MGTTPISVEAHGVTELLEKIIRPFIGRLQGNKLELIPDEFLPSGDRVVVLAHSVATGSSGKPYENQYAMIFTVRDGTHFSPSRVPRHSALGDSGLRPCSELDLRGVWGHLSVVSHDAF